jgi:hypothetical protein
MEEITDSGLENREYGRAVLSDTLYPHKLAITLPTSDGRSVSIVRSRTKATELVLCFVGPDALITRLGKET